MNSIVAVVLSGVTGGVLGNKGYKHIRKFINGIDKKKATVLGAVVFTAVAAVIAFLVSEFVFDKNYSEAIENNDDIEDFDDKDNN